MWVKAVNKNQKLRTVAPATVTNGGAARITAAQLVENLMPISGVILSSAAANTGIIYFGDSTVTTSNGTPLAAGEKISLPISDPYDVYAVGSVASQTLYISYV